MKHTLALHASNLYAWSRLHFSKAVCEQQAEKQKGALNANADNAQQSSASFNTEEKMCTCAQPVPQGIAHSCARGAVYLRPHKTLLAL